MTLQANANGVVAGTFIIPSNMPSGTHTVEFLGSGGSHGTANYVGQSSLEIDAYKLVTNISINHYDPLAQTFTLDTSRQCVGVNLWFTTKPTSLVEVQLRDVVAGFPGKTIYGTARLPGNSTLITGAATQFLFDSPITIEANNDYAIVVLCNDAVGAIAVAELGKWDTVSGKWVTTQPYTVGVLLMSSNATTWTVDQTRDMTFELLLASYTETQHTVNLGNFAVTNATDLILMSGAIIPTSACRVDYRLTFPDGTIKMVSSDQAVQLSAPVTGNIKVEAILYGNSNFSPILLPGTELLIGVLATSGSYVSRAIPAGPNVTIKVVFDSILPSGSTVNVDFVGIDALDAWASVPYAASFQNEDGSIELTYELAGVTEDYVHVRLSLNGSAAARPRVSNLRIFIV